MRNSFNEKINKRCYKNFDKEKLKFDLGKVNWQKHFNDSDSNVSMEHFLKVVKTLLQTCMLNILQ